MLHPVYYIILFVITFYSYIDINNNGIKARIKVPYIVISSIFIFLCGIRVAQGADYWPYYKLYMSINKFVKWSDLFDADVEVSYVLISKILGYFRMPFFALLFIYGLISISLKTYSYYKYSPYPMISLLYFFMPNYFFSDSGHIRQGVSIALCLFSYQYIEQRKLFKFLFCIFISYYFHKTALIFIPAYWITKLNLSTFSCFLIILFAIIISPFKPYLFFENLFSNISSDIIAEATGGFYSYKNLESAGWSINDIVKLIFITTLLVNDRYICNTTSDENYKMIRNLVVTYYFIYYSLRENSIFSIRLPAAYGDFWAILIAMIIKYSKKTYNHIIYFFFIIYIYLMSWRIWPNSVALGFDKMSNIFSDDFDIKYFIPYEFIDE
ncbi:EpsG family protein [uncultured Apibacter sp.]|uniref:EpsG family protein n=1 Tax=uncultured Apibacter sp. TaxID=1778616 RepID=UPI0025D716C7|nr:EpsG family protein [uncultured Apibacter sp.]